MIKPLKILTSGIFLSSLFTPFSVYADTGKYNMSYVFAGSDSTYISSVDSTNGSLNEISPDFFGIDSNGNLTVTSGLTSSFVSSMHQRGVKVVPKLSAGWDRTIGEAALANRQNLANQIASKVSSYNLDGVDVDIEDLNNTDKDNQTDFIRLLRLAMPNKIISVAVDANPDGWTLGWQGSYDYLNLSKYADYLMIMAYDYSYEGSDPNPVAPYPWVVSSIQYALNQGVPANKIVLGIPFYGRLWDNDGSIKGLGVSDWVITNLIQNYHGTTFYDSTQKSMKVTFTINAGDTLPTVSWHQLQPGTYTVWYDDQSSIKEKLKLVQQFNLKGAGSWSLGQEENGTWSYFKYWLNGTYYSVYQNENDVSDFKYLSDAINYGETLDHTYVLNQQNSHVEWDDYPLSFTPKKITFSQNANLYKSPASDSQVVGVISPQSIIGVEEKTLRGDWFHVTTYAGDAWVNAQGANVSDVPQTPKTVTIEKTASAYNSPYQTSSVGSFAPQTVTELMNYGNGYALISTSLGPKWITPNTYIPDVTTKDIKKVTFNANETLYDYPFSDSPSKAYSLAPQTVTSYEEWNGWYHIYTGIGDKWIHPDSLNIVNPTSEVQRIHLTGYEPMYNAPFDGAKIGWGLAPQTVTSYEDWNGWYHIYTGVGDKWIHPTNALTGSPTPLIQPITLTTIQSLYNSPSQTDKSSWALAPQTVTSFEQWGNWYHIYTGIGDKWIQGTDVINGVPTKSIEKITLSTTISLYNAPFDDTKTSWALAPQTVTAFENWNGWHHIYTGVGDKWIHQ